MGFTAEELAEMARADAEIEASFRLTRDDLERSKRLDRYAVIESFDNKRIRVAAQKKAYREANRERVAAQQKAYYEANRERVAAQKKAYYEANRERLAEQKKKIGNAMKARGYTALDVSRLIDMSRQTIYNWVTGAVPADWKKLEKVLELNEGTCHAD